MCLAGPRRCASRFLLFARNELADFGHNCCCVRFLLGDKDFTSINTWGEAENQGRLVGKELSGSGLDTLACMFESFPVALIKYSDRLSERRRGLFDSQFQGTDHHFGEVEATGA